MKTTTTSERKWQGAKWCRPSTRLAIYLRDGMACVWCGHSVEDGATLSLDHVTPHANGGTNNPTNLVTSCSRCNSSRGTRSVPRFAAAVAEYLNHDADPEKIIRHVHTTRRRVLPRAEALALIARR